ncbi:MAG TPA: hypothetical protein VFG59_10480 [Anaeromyxobacter sp.]|nr:hypothetical protein [Anaeromyxobacter sp.]
MRRVNVLVLCGAGMAALLACGSSHSGSEGSGGGGVGGGSCSGPTPVSLTVRNYLSWCSVSVNGETASSAPEQTTCVPAGTVPLSAVALPGFELGARPWHHTDGDSGMGEQGTVIGSGQSAMSTANVTVSGASACAWVCCETAGTSDCPTMDLCP